MGQVGIFSCSNSVALRRGDFSTVFRWVVQTHKHVQNKQIIDNPSTGQFADLGERIAGIYLAGEMGFITFPGDASVGNRRKSARVIQKDVQSTGIRGKHPPQALFSQHQ